MEKRTCTATTKRGKRCKARAVERGLCVAHAGLVDMSAIGKLGGRKPKLTALRRAAAEQDDSLRDLAAQTLERALRGEQVDPAQLRAASSLYSFRAEQPPPRSPELGEYRGPLMPDGRRPIGLDDVIAFALAHEGTRDAMESMIAEGRRKAQAFAGTPSAEVPQGILLPPSTATGDVDPPPPQPESESQNPTFPS